MIKGQTDVVLQRLRTVIDAYGAAPERWPAAERPALEALLQSNAKAQQWLVEARELDQAMDAIAMPEPAPQLMADILYIPPRSDWRQTMALFWPFGALWKPASGLAFATALSIVVAMTIPMADTETELIEEIETEILG